jgi:hypothetical protein
VHPHRRHQAGLDAVHDGQAVDRAGRVGVERDRGAEDHVRHVATNVALAAPPLTATSTCAPKSSQNPFQTTVSWPIGVCTTVV